MATNFRINAKALVNHVGTNFRKVTRLALKAIHQIRASIIVVPDELWGLNPDAGKLDENVKQTRAAFVEWERGFNKKSMEVEAWEANNARIFNLLLLYYSPEFRSKLKGKRGWSTTEGDQNGIVLLDWIKIISHQKDGSKQGVLEVVHLELNLYLCMQGDRSVNQYLWAFKGVIEPIKAVVAARAWTWQIAEL